MATDLALAVAAAEEKQALLAAARAKKDETAHALARARLTAAKKRNEIGQTVADGGDATDAKAALMAALTEVDAFEAALLETQTRVNRAANDARKATLEAWRRELDGHVVEAEKCAADTLAATAVLAQSHARWHAIARRCEELATLLGRPGQPVPFDGQHGQLCRDLDDGGGIVGVLRRHGVSATFGAIRDRLPRINGECAPVIVEDAPFGDP